MNLRRVWIFVAYIYKYPLGQNKLFGSHPHSIIHAVNPVPVPLRVRLQPACGRPLGQVVGNTPARNQAVGPRVESEP